jgi:hypothetical protein
MMVVVLVERGVGVVVVPLRYVGSERRSSHRIRLTSHVHSNAPVCCGWF